MEELNEIESVIGFEPLFKSMLKCTGGVLWKDSVAAFYHTGIRSVMKLNRQLQNKTYHARPPVHFTITSPKRREIASVAFRDRVYQRSLNDNVVYPAVTNSFIHDNFACQKGKGTDAARERLKQFLHEYYRKYGREGYVAQFDIHGYYPNMDHKIVEDNFKNYLSNWSFERVQEILHYQYEGDVGYNPGSQLVQIAGVAMLDKLDHFIKEQLHIRYYIRYMDDFILIHHDKEYLKECQLRIIEEIQKIKFTINEKKTVIYKISEGIPFLGFNFFLTNTGKVLMLLKSENVKAQRKKLVRLVTKAKNGHMTKAKVDESYAAWRNHASKGNNYKLLQRMDAYYNSLWR